MPHHSIVLMKLALNIIQNMTIEPSSSAREFEMAFATTPPSTTVLTPPPGCLNPPTFTGNPPFRTPPSVAPIINIWADDTCFPSGWRHVAPVSPVYYNTPSPFSPGVVCPSGYTTDVLTISLATTTAYCCPSYVRNTGISSAVSWQADSLRSSFQIDDMPGICSSWRTEWVWVSSTNAGELQTQTTAATLVVYPVVLAFELSDQLAHMATPPQG